MADEDLHANLPKSSFLVEESIPFLHAMKDVGFVSNPKAKQTGWTLVNAVETSPDRFSDKAYALSWHPNNIDARRLLIENLCRKYVSFQMPPLTHVVGLALI